MNEPEKRPWSVPTLEDLGSVTEVTLINMVGPNPDIQLSSPSEPA